MLNKESKETEALEKQVEEAYKQLWHEREYAYDSKVSSKGKGWAEAIQHYDNIGHNLLFVKNTIDELLTEYEAIKNAEPTKALECLEKLYVNFLIEEYDGTTLMQDIDKYYTTIKQALLQKQIVIDNSKVLNALDDVAKAPTFMGCNPKYQYHTKSEIPFMEDINTIKQALIQTSKTKQEIQQELEQYYFKLIELLKEYNQDYYTLKETLETKSKKEQAWDIVVKKPYNSGLCINYLKVNKHYPNMQDYEHYCMTIREFDRVTEEEFNTLKENVNENN